MKKIAISGLVVLSLTYSCNFIYAQESFIQKNNIQVASNETVPNIFETNESSQEVNEPSQETKEQDIKINTKVIDEYEMNTRGNKTVSPDKVDEKTATQDKGQVLQKDVKTDDFDIEKNINREDVFKNIANQSTVIRLSSQSKEELNALYARGFRVFEITISATSDDQLVLADNFNEYFKKYYGKPMSRLSISQYFSHKMLKSQTQMSMGDINMFLDKNPDARFFVNTLDTQKNIMGIFNSKPFKNKDKLIIETKSTIEKYNTFKNIAIVDLKGKDAIESYITNNADTDVIFLYKNTSPSFEEMQAIKQNNKKIYENKKNITDKIYTQNISGNIYPIEDASKLTVKKPEKNHQNNVYVRPKIQNDRFIAHAGGKYAGITLTNALQAMENSYVRGNRMLEIDFDWTTDGKLVQVHDWATFRKLSNDADLQNTYMTYDEFKQRSLIYKLNPMSIDDTINFLKNKTDAYIVTDVKEDNMKDGNFKALSEFSEAGQDIQSRIIPQIYDINNYQKIRDLGYKNIIYTLYRTDLSAFNVVEFAKSNDLYAVTIDNQYRVNTTLPVLLMQNGIRVYTHTENDINRAKGFINSGKVYGIYSDDILSLQELNM